MNFNERMVRLRSDLEKPLLVSKLANLRYLSGFGGSSAFLLVWPERSVFVTDGRYGELSAPLVDALDDAALEVYSGKLPEVLAKLMNGSPRFQLEADGATWEFMRSLDEAYSGEIEPATGTVEVLRAVKDETEVAALRAAAAAGDATFAELPRLLGAVNTEAELAWLLVSEMRGRGGEPADWDPIVAAGANASRPHHETGSTPIGEGLLLLDYGCVVDGYHSDMSRTVWLGDAAPDADTLAIHSAVAEAQAAGIAAVAPGVTAGEVDRAAREVLERLSYGEHFVHSTGHGVGLEIHEAPSIAKAKPDALEPGMVITVEPGVYLQGTGGVRIEDMVLVTETGSELLTASDRAIR
jgi:Xaa-Pro aminopeptidase